MNESQIPPVLEQTPQPPPLPQPRPKWRWAVHLAVLAAYVLGLGLISREAPATADIEAALPTTVRGLLIFCALQVGIFAVFFVVAWLFSRATVDELRLRWRGGLMPFVWGGVHSFLLRLLVAIGLFVVLVPYAAIQGEQAMEEKVTELRPKVEVIIEPKAMNDPVYLGLVLTVVSFIVAGLREELWRAGMLAGLAGLFPGLFQSRKGQMMAVFLVAAVFGIGHAPQGAGAVALTGLLGLGLGAIMVMHRSIWEAVIAHGFFDALSFTGLWFISKNPELMKQIGIS